MMSQVLEALLLALKNKGKKKRSEDFFRSFTSCPIRVYEKDSKVITSWYNICINSLWLWSANYDLLFMSGYQDSNLGPPAPKAGALTGLRYTPFCNPFIVDCGAKVSIYFYPPNISCSFLIVYFRICLITRFKGKEVKQQKEGQADMNILLANML